MIDLVANIRARLTPLLVEVEGALDRRAQQYPDLVAKGRMDEKTAAHEIRIWRAIAADWRRTVSGRGKGGGATIEEKIAILTETVGRYDAAMGKEIRASNSKIQRDIGMGADLYMLRFLHGDAINSIVDIHQRRDRIEEIRDLYRQELPGHQGLHRGIDDYLDFHQRARADRQQRKAA